MSEPQSPKPAPREEITFGDLQGLLWRKLKEMRTVFYLLVVLAIGSLIATVLPQQQPAEYYQERFGQFLANIITRLALDHVSTATWFLVLMAVLMLSLVACTGNLWRIAKLRWRVPGEANLDQVAAQVRQSAPRTVTAAPEAAVARAQAAAAKAGFQAWDVGTRDNTRYLYLCRNRRSAWGTALTHYAIFLVGLGALLGALPGVAVDELLDIKEGAVGKSESGRVPFGVRLDSFRIQIDPKTQAIGNYFSDVTLLEGEREVGKHTISVNHPLKYRGFFLSQVNWSLGEAKVQVKSNGKTTDLAFPLARGNCPEMDPNASEWGVPEDNAVSFLPTRSAALVASEFYISAKREKGEVLGRNSETPDNPALHLILVTGIPKRPIPLAALPTDSAPVAGDGTAATDLTISFAADHGALAQMMPPHGMGENMPPAMPPHGMGGGMGGTMSPHGMGGAMPPAGGGHGGKKPGHGLTDLGFLLQGETKHTPVGDITFTGVTESSGIGVRRDPGVPLVWAGFIACVVGMSLLFYFPVTQAYLAISTREGRAGESRVQLQVRGGLMSDPAGDTKRLLDALGAASVEEGRGKQS